MSIPIPGFLRRAQRPGRAPRSVDPELLPVSPAWFYAVTLADGTQHLTLSAAAGTTIYAHVPSGTVVVPTTPLAIHQAAGAYLWKAREAGGVAGDDLEALTLDVSALAAPLVIEEVRFRGGFRNGWAERLQLSGLKVVSPEGLVRATCQLPSLLRTRGLGVGLPALPDGTPSAMVHGLRKIPAPA